MIVAIGMFLVLGPFVLLIMAMLVAMYIDMICNKQWIGLAFCTSMLIGLFLLGIDLVRFVIAN
jgi:hypothetical protein